MQQKRIDYSDIESHGIIGNMNTAALVSMDGTIDFLCFPQFDSPTIFASLLDTEKGGHFSIKPDIDVIRTKQLYVPGTAVLITRFFADQGIVEITDYMPVNGYSSIGFHAIVRKIKVIRGHVNFEVNCKPRFHYAMVGHKARREEGSIFFETEKEDLGTLKLSSDCKLRTKDHDAYSSFKLQESEEALFVLECAEKGKEAKFKDLEEYSEENYTTTVTFWRKWLRQSRYKGKWQETVDRSAITLKLLTSLEHGSVVAAATFGLPEEIGGDRNWDYRYTWIRDAAFTMFVFLKLGFTEEAKRFLEWLKEQDEDRGLHLLYRMDGVYEMTEKELNHLKGYKDSRPVRIGNEANNQLQLDIYGELLDTVYIYNEMHRPITFELWHIIAKEIEQVEKSWRKPDHGIWEIRNEKHEFLNSRLMCWVAVDRAIKIAQDRSFPYETAKWHQLRNDIYQDIYHNFWNESKQAWVQYKDGDKVADSMDASVMLMPLVNFITPDEPRWISTMDAVERDLKLDVLIYRYTNEDDIDGLEGEEGTFTMCSFWYVECLAQMGRLDEAVENFEKMLGYGNHLGLFSEQISKDGRHLGNFPQAFTHLGLISAALELDKQIKRVAEKQYDT